MIRSAAGKALGLGRAAVVPVVVAVMLVLVFGVDSPASAHGGYKGVLHLGHNNAIAKATTLVGKVATGSTLVVKNPSGGSALGLQVNAGQAPLTVNADAGTATNFDADKLDGIDSTAFAAAAHNHDVRYYSKTESDGRYLGKTEKATDADKLDGKNSSDFAAAYKRTVVVGPVGSATQNGTALKNALSGITNASATNPYLIKIEPGVYDLGAAPGLQMKSWVDIEGSGEGVTTLTATGSQSFQTGTVVGTSNSELRFLTVKNTGGSTYAAAVYYSTAGPLRLIHVSAAASGGTSASYGMRIDAGSASLNQLTADASGTSQNLGVFVGSGGTATLTQATLSASGGSQNFGFSKNNNNAMEIRESRIVGSTNTVRNFGGTGTIRVGGSQLSGGGPAEATTCAGVYDENYAFYASTCP